MSEENIRCARHGEVQPSAMCIHLCQSDGLGYVESPENEEDHAWAWCQECDETISKIGPDEDVNLAHLFKIVCEKCYAERKSVSTFLSWSE